MPGQTSSAFRVPPGLCHLLALAWAAILIPFAVGLLAGAGFALLAAGIVGAAALYVAEWVLTPDTGPPAQTGGPR